MKEFFVSQLSRQLSILKILLHTTQPLSTTEINERLQSVGVSRKTIQRDLEALEDLGVRSRRVGKSCYWRLDRPSLKLSMPPNEAMNLAMIFDHARRFGMETQVADFTEFHQYVNRTLKQANPGIDWSKRLTSTTRFITLQPSKVDSKVLKELQKAILEGRSVQAVYQAANAPEPKTYRLKPLGLSYQDSNIYLSCVFDGRPGQLAALPLHRFLSVSDILEQIPAPDDYDINSVEAQRSLISLESEEPVRLVLRLHGDNLYRRLRENPLNEGQQLLPDTHGTWRLETSMLLSQGLELWLLGQAADLEVLEPSGLREKIADKARRMAALYQ